MTAVSGRGFPEHYVGSEPSRKAQSIGICRSEWCAQAGMTEAEMDCVGVATKDGGETEA